MATLSGPLRPTSDATAVMYRAGVRSYKRFKADKFVGGKHIEPKLPWGKGNDESAMM